jgi:molecular chaperone GrpE
MENTTSKKPLRQSTNTARDLKDIYQSGEKIININSFEEEEKNREEAGKDIEQKVKEAMESGIEEEITHNIPEALPEEPPHDKITEEEINTLSESSENFKRENDLLKDSLARKTAEMENMRRRTIKEKQDLVEYANEKLLAKLVEIPDVIKQALSAANSSTDFDSLKIGVEMIYQKTLSLFEEAGVKTMPDAKGKEFDYELHEALMHTASEDIDEGNVIQVVQDGYTFGEKVLRHAKVITSAGKE